MFVVKIIMLTTYYQSEEEYSTRQCSLKAMQLSGVGKMFVVKIIIVTTCQNEEEKGKDKIVLNVN